MCVFLKLFVRDLLYKFIDSIDLKWCIGRFEMVYGDLHILYLKIGFNKWNKYYSNFKFWAVVCCTLPCTGVHWRALACSGVLWCALACIDVLWRALACSGVHWRALACTGVLWCELACSGVHWRALGWIGVLWCESVSYTHLTLPTKRIV